jgi:uncharacterized protein (DUF1800 family)
MFTTLILLACVACKTSTSGLPGEEGVDQNPQPVAEGPGTPGSGFVPSELRPKLNYGTPTEEEAVRFLAQTSFGAIPETVPDVQRLGYKAWLREQFEMPRGPSALQRYDENVAAGGRIYPDVVGNDFWDRALHADDQLRYRTALALSQIVVVSFAHTEMANVPRTFASYVDIIYDGAFGNYCDIIRDVTYSPAMALYLTYFGNRKRDELNGFVPDENYAREIMQLFTIGLDELNLDGTPTGEPTYTQADVSGLASIFTGLSSPNQNFGTPKPQKQNQTYRLQEFPEYHEGRAKTFLGKTINYGASPEKSISAALDHLLAHKNVAPFISKHLIQKLVTSNPSPSYVARVATAFNNGRFDMQDGHVVGSGRRCDMKATLSAILLDPEARLEEAWQKPDFGRVKSPVETVAHILRLFGEQQDVTVSGQIPTAGWLSYDSNYNGMWALGPPSVFGFYRAGYAPPSSEIAKRDLVGPELQLYTTTYSMASLSWPDIARQESEWFGVYKPSYDWLLPLTSSPEQLLEALTRYLTASRLETDTEERILKAIGNVPYNADNADLIERRIAVTSMFMMSAPDFLVQR